jgi:DNA-binding beta-propeller fold protein YncE
MPSRIFACLIILCLFWSLSAPAGEVVSPGASSGRITREGLNIDYLFSRPDGKAVMPLAGEPAELKLTVTDVLSGKPVRGLRPAAWLDAQVNDPAAQGRASGCRERVGVYLKGIVGMRPLVDFNSYYLLVMNQDASISVIDPVVSMTGRTSLVTSILLKGPAIDWVKSRDGARLFVAVPRAREIAIIDTTTFKAVGHVVLPAPPSRVALQPDGKFLWVGHEGSPEQHGGVFAVDTDTGAVAAQIATGRGHHEFAFAGEGRMLAVTNRGDGTLSLIDTVEKRVSLTHAVGADAVAVTYSALSGLFYVGNGGGELHVFDARSGMSRNTIRLPDGAGPLGTSPDGRWLFALNTAGRRVHLIDTATGQRASDVRVDGQPFQMVFTDAFAHIRSLDSRSVSMINLVELGNNRVPVVNHYEVGTAAPGAAPDLPIARGITRAADDSAVFVASPGDATVYFYMEGMNATAGSFQGYGHSPRAVEVVNRSIREVQPGVYLASSRVPASGVFSVALMTDAPRVVECFDVTVGSNPRFSESAPPRIEFMDMEKKVAPRSVREVRFRLLKDGRAAAGLQPQVRFYRVPGSDRGTAQAAEISPGLYSATVPVGDAGAWVVHVLVPFESGRPPQQSYITLVAR